MVTRIQLAEAQPPPRRERAGSAPGARRVNEGDELAVVVVGVAPRARLVLGLAG